MATITSHTLNGVDGTHAGSVSVSVFLLSNEAADHGSTTLLAVGKTDSSGRVMLEIAASKLDPAGRYEMVFDTVGYWRERGVAEANLIDQIVLRFSMPDPNGKYHMPVIISPFGYSTWKSG